MIGNVKESALGKRKSSIARVRMVKGNGKILIRCKFNQKVSSGYCI